MNFDEYQKFATDTDLVHPLNYYFLGLAEEAGEVCGLRKRYLRDEGNIDYAALNKECGDVLWYISMICKKYGISLQDVAITNLQKLEDRKNRGVITGTGSER